MDNSKKTISEKQFEKLNLKPDALFNAARRHEETLYRVNIEPLRKLNEIDDDYLYWFTHLFLMTFFYDYCLDRALEEQFPEALFISANMFNDYENFIRKSYGDDGLILLARNNADQVYYQMIEKQWLHPSEYQSVHPDYWEYFRKQILCMTHIELLKLDKRTFDLSEPLKQLYKRYWSLILLIDDIMDVERDIESKTITPMIAHYYSIHRNMPCVDDSPQLVKYGLDELNRLYAPFIKVSERIGLLDYQRIIDSLSTQIEFKV